MSGAIEAFSDKVLFGLLAEAPDLALNLGIAEVAGRVLPGDGLPDFSEAGADRRARLMVAWSDELDRLPNHDDSPVDALTRQVLQFFLGPGFLNRFYGRDGRQLGDQVDPLTHLTGVHATAVEMFVRDHPLATPLEAELYVERLSKLPGAIRDATQTLRSRRRRGLLGPRLVLAQAARDIRASLREQAQQHQFYRTLAAGIENTSAVRRALFLERAAGLIAGEMRAAYELLLNELALHIEAAGEMGQSAVSADRGAFYRWRFAGRTTTPLAPADAHRLGQEELIRVRTQLCTEFRALDIDLPLADAFAALTALHRYPAGERGRIEALESCRKQVADAQVALRPLFNLWPRAIAVVQPIEPENEDSQHSHYVPPGAANGSVGVFWVNLLQMLAAPRSEAALYCFHETWPGHHVQLALAQELPLPAFRRAILFDGYMEGWAKYAESLPETVGLANSPTLRIARLRMELYSTATLILDTGVHAHGWSLESAQKFFSRETGASDALAAGTVLRCAAEPAQLCAYKIGMLKMRELRDRYHRARGGDYRIQDYHDAVLGQGALPLSILEAVVDAAAARQRR
jgi:uncharacterized protein (DUF885 family)